MSAGRTAVLLMAYGSPNRLDEVEAYYTDIRGGRRPPPEQVADLRERYRRVGVPTPLLEVSRIVAQELERALNASSAGESYRVTLGMKHWTPRIREAVEEAVSGGVERLVAIVLAPHYSRIGTEGYRAQLARALAELAPAVPLDFVQSWHDLDGYLDAVAENVSAQAAGFKRAGDVMVVFTAHSLPARILAEGDPYQEQLVFSAARIAERAGTTRWRFSYQSQSHTGEPWLGPDLLETLGELAASGERQVLVAPVGFIADHLEILYDIDLEAQEKASALGIELRRMPMLNADPRLVAALAGLVQARAWAPPSMPSRARR